MVEWKLKVERRRCDTLKLNYYFIYQAYLDATDVLLKYFRNYIERRYLKEPGGGGPVPRDGLPLARDQD